MMIMHDKFVKRGRQQQWPISNTSLGLPLECLRKTTLNLRILGVVAKIQTGYL
jgi:hypothetical protein